MGETRTRTCERGLPLPLQITNLQLDPPPRPRVTPSTEIHSRRTQELNILFRKSNH